MFRQRSADFQEDASLGGDSGEESAEGSEENGETWSVSDAALAQCGPKVFIMDDTGLRVMDMKEKTPKEVNCFPRMPQINDPVVYFEANKKQDKLLLVTESQLVVVNLARYGQKLVGSSGSLGGTMKRSEDEEDMWDLSMKSIGFQECVELSGKLDEAESGASFFVGRIDGKSGEAISDLTLECISPLNSGTILDGDGKLMFNGVEVRDVEVQLTITKAMESVGGALRLHGTLGEVNLSFGSSSYFLETVVDACWHPLLPNQCMILFKDGTIHIYDFSKPSLCCIPIVVQSVLPSLDMQYVSMSFGASLGCRDVPSKCGILTLFRRLTLFVLCSNGAIFAICPAGFYGGKVSELEFLKSCLEREITSEQQHKKTTTINLPLEKHLEWVTKCLNEEHSPATYPQPQPVMIATPPKRSTLQTATSLSCFPLKSSSQLTFLRGWDNGTIDSLIGGGPITPLWTSGHQTPKSAIADAPVSGGSLLNSPLKTASSPDSRNSPLKNLAEKIPAALQQNSSPGVIGRFSAKTGAQFETPVKTSVALARSKNSTGKQGESNGIIPAKWLSRHVGTMKMPCDDQVFISLTRSQLLPNAGIACVDSVDSRSLFLLWLPWIEKDGEKLSSSPERLGRLLCRGLPRFADDTPIYTVVVEPGVGHKVLVMFPQNKMFSIDISAEFITMEATLSADLCLENDRSDLAITDGVEVDEEEIGSQLDDIKRLCIRQLSHLTNIPPKVAKLKPFEKDAPLEMGLAVCSWLREVADGLLYGSSSSSQGLMQALTAGYSMIEEHRVRQAETFRMQLETIKRLQQDFNDVREDHAIASRKRENILLLQGSTLEGIEVIGAALDSHAQAVNPEVIRRIDDMVERVRQLKEGIATIKERVAKEDRLEVKQDSVRGGGLHGLFDSDDGKHIRELQERTEQLIDRMIGDGGSGSVFKLQAGVTEATTHLKQVLVSFVAVRSSVVLEIEALILDGSCTSIMVDKRILDPASQASYRESAGLKAWECPRYLSVSSFGEKKENVELVLLPENGVDVVVRDNTILITARLGSESLTEYEQDEERSVKQVELDSEKAAFELVALVGFTMMPSEAGVITGLKICDESEDIPQFCDLVTSLLDSRTSGLTRVL